MQGDFTIIQIARNFLLGLIGKSLPTLYLKDLNWKELLRD